MKFNIKTFLKTYLTEFRKNWYRYLYLFVGMNFLLLLVVIPLFNWLAALVMRISGIPYLSYSNLGNLFSKHLLGVLGLFILLILLLATVFVQFAIQFHGVRYIQQGRGRFRIVVGDSLRSLRKVSLPAFGFFLFYFLLILPFGRIVFSTPLLSKIKIPVFTFGFFTSSWQNMLILGTFYLIIFLLGSKLIFVLPSMILKENTLKKAVQESLGLTSLKRFIYFILYFAIIGAGATALSFGVKYLLYLLQIVLDETPVEFVSALLLLTLGNLWGMLISALAGMLLFSFLIEELGFPLETVEAQKKKTSIARIYRIFSAAFTLLFFLTYVASNWSYLSGAMDVVPLRISHRGVDNGNGVQNSIAALELTAKNEPDYVEMDIQETADQQFVVMHDADLKALTGAAGSCQEKTLDELLQLKVTENGKSAPVASFDDYYAAAEKLGQELLIEIKTSPKDSSDMLKNFVKKYGARILKNNDMVHSLDYRVITGLKKLSPKIPVSFILPINFAFPQTDANAYTQEATTLDYDFVSQAHDDKQKVFAWTVNDRKIMERQIFNGVDGIITDRLSDLKAAIAESEGNINYADRLLVQFSLEPSPGDNAVN
ncbi:MAG: glycerophosphodiester phosphodiesterase [Streptococcaceae bacterium]|jgi:glycerophosphoryl diester phosphodiesterase|nr:glycerophosphodiester phosphodiesterase [Streptococcaceae bacterium]